MQSQIHARQTAKRRGAWALAAVMTASLACGSGLPVPGGDGPGALPSQLAGVAGTAQAAAQTAQVVLPATATALAATLAAGMADLEPTAQALATQLAGSAESAATAMAQITPPQFVDQDAAAEVIVLYAQEILGRDVTIVRAGGLTGDIEREIELPEDGEAAQSAGANVAAQTYAAVLSGGAGSVSYAAGSFDGDLSVEINSASLGAFSFEAGPLPGSPDEALAMALQAFPALAGRDFTPYPSPRGYAWLAVGVAPGTDLETRQAAMVAESILLAVTPTVARRTAISVVVGKGAFAADVAP